MTEHPTDPNHEETEETPDVSPDVEVAVDGDADVTVNNGDENVARNDKDDDGNEDDDTTA